MRTPPEETHEGGFGSGRLAVQLVDLLRGSDSEIGESGLGADVDEGAEAAGRACPLSSVMVKASMPSTVAAMVLVLLSDSVEGPVGVGEVLDGPLVRGVDSSCVR